MGHEAGAVGATVVAGLQWFLVIVVVGGAGGWG